ncbi:MAG: NAD-dependent epimerase/dehydratase family protein [Pseudomonadota bacterium]|nr:NAD-dependent epimerase/dehydratase family protein [Pseudomonadota bacterium]
MKFLVTGGAGFIGSHLVETLYKSGHTVVVVDKMQTKKRLPGVFYHEEDITDYHATRTLYKGIDQVFHLAAEANITACIEKPLRATKVNALGTATVLQCSKEANVRRVIYSSTSAAYGKNTTPNTEDQIEDCLNPYSLSKIVGEKFCKMFSDLYGLETVVLRYFNVYGDGQAHTGQYAPVMSLFLHQNKTGQPLTIVGDGSQTRDFIHVSDVVAANIAASNYNKAEPLKGQIFNVGTGKAYTIQDIAHLISGNIRYLQNRPGEIVHSVANIEKVKNFFSWTPKIGLDMWLKNKLCFIGLEK